MSAPVMVSIPVHLLFPFPSSLLPLALPQCRVPLLSLPLLPMLYWFYFHCFRPPRPVFPLPPLPLPGGASGRDALLAPGSSSGTDSPCSPRREARVKSCSRLMASTLFTISSITKPRNQRPVGRGGGTGQGGGGGGGVTDRGNRGAGGGGGCVTIRSHKGEHRGERQAQGERGRCVSRQGWRQQGQTGG